MKWVDTVASQEGAGRRAMTRGGATRMLQAALAAQPDRLALYERLGFALKEEGRHREAIEAYMRRASAEPERFRSWGALAECHLALGDVATALAVCAAGESHGGCPDLARAYGLARVAAGDLDGGIGDLRAAYTADPADEVALEALLHGLARAKAPEVLHEFCQTLPEARAVERAAFTALSYSLMDRRAEALALIDPWRQAMRFRMPEGAARHGLAALKARLRDLLVARAANAFEASPGCRIDDGLQRVDDPALSDLRAFVREAMDAYLAAHPEPALRGGLVAPGRAALLLTGLVLRGEGRNGEHVHSRSTLTGPFYVHVPRSIDATSHAGWLALGSCRRIAGGHEPVWGVRMMRPEAGTLILFPSHMFHDVVPTDDGEERIAVATDLRPADGI